MIDHFLFQTRLNTCYMPKYTLPVCFGCVILEDQIGPELKWDLTLAWLVGLGPTAVM